MTDAEKGNVEIVRRPGGIGTIVINRPEKLNALDGDTLLALAAALAELAADAALGVLLITGSGEKAFSAGADIAAMAAMPAGGGHEYARLGHAVMAAVEGFPFPGLGGGNGGRPRGGRGVALGR